MAGSPIQIDEKGLVQLSTDDGTTWLTIGNLTNISADHTRDEPTDTFVFGSTTPHSKSGERSDSYSFDGLYESGDDGQDQAMDSLEDGDEVLMEYYPDGTTASAAGKQQDVFITGVSISGDRSGDFWEVSISAIGTGAVTDVTVST